MVDSKESYKFDLGVEGLHNFKTFGQNCFIQVYFPSLLYMQGKYLNPLTPMSDQERISPYIDQYKIKKTSDENQEKY